MEYTHILSIHVWSDKIGQTTTHGNILNHVKDYITNDIQTQELEYNGKLTLFSVKWKKNVWNTMMSSLYNGDIVMHMPDIEDNIIYQHTTKMLQEIKEQLCKEKKINSEYDIIFSIVKPIVYNVVTSENEIVSYA